MSYFAELDANNVVLRVVVADNIQWCIDNLPITVQVGTETVEGPDGPIEVPIYEQQPSKWAETSDPYADPTPVTYCGPGFGHDPAVREQFALPWDIDAATVPNTEGDYAYSTIGQVVFHNGKIWRNTIATGTPNVWEPGVSGWREYTMGDTYPVWLQPTGAHDAYLVDEIVEHDGKVWRNVTPANVWEPGTGVLWEDMSPPPPIAEWVQPTGAQDAYNTGDRVLFNGVTYESLINANVWSPTAYPAGWAIIEGA